MSEFRFMPDGPDLKPNAWKLFIDANRSSKEWEEWHLLPDGDGCGRFFGDPTGLSELKELLDSLNLAASVFDFELDANGGWGQILNRIYKVAVLLGTPILRYRYSLWPDIEIPNGWDWDEMMYQLAETEDGKYPLHPFRESLVYDMHFSTIAAIEIMLDPESALLLDDPDGDLPFVFPEDELDIAETPFPPASEQQEHTPSVSQSERKPAESTKYQFSFESDGYWHLRFPGDVCPQR